MTLFNQLFYNKLNFFDKLSFLLFSVLPISIIIGNAAININLWLISLLFLIYCFKFKIWSWLKKNIFLYLITLYFFLYLNSLYSYFVIFENQTNPFWTDDGIKRSLTFIKFVFLVLAFSILLKDRKILDLVHKSWFCVILIVIVDIFFERLLGRNIIGNVSPDGTRIVSFFKDELVVGGFVFCFGYASVSYFINNKAKSKYILPIFIHTNQFCCFSRKHTTKVDINRSHCYYLLLVLFLYPLVIKRDEIRFTYCDYIQKH